MIGMIDLIGSIQTMIGNLMGRLGEELQFMIGWGAGSACMTDWGRASVHDWLGGRLSVHDRLGDRVRYFPRNQEELEEMADARVPDEFIFCRDANTYRVEPRGNHRPSVRQPQWCLEGLTRT